ncbi:tRNA 2-selenouridine(34) synthase MnmH [Pseudoroseicyclus tamaricis]|uniref:tRNA 2-selenouridine(34) synthase MnmH n=1 Tax=Pseudoroseicyclus tamaricis TaxID=2705421 RepID=A0A6B2JSK1_9RHOB|nr:tRNA 2-selenouridine(34) synthase MnmH [Pseudoroseicyclus tamaricis]NDU99548.1 tRNA 2-selenouridine(34) synthase MnmH [Pseudoroseicyclus tamaricis]
MARSFASLSDFLAHGFDDVIDVRSPAEFAEDHVPGALSLPVLSNEERAEVGTIYVQESPFRARKIGAALVARNAADHIAGPLADRDGGWRPLVYCWRGGQRSNSFASILSQIGWRAEVVQGGYKTWRRLVSEALYEGELPLRLVLLDGDTGTAKTELLHRLAARGRPVLDLEGLARHRGSLLGTMPGGQPAQKGFETELAVVLSQLEPGAVVLAEAESSKIGALSLPPALWKAMGAAGRIVIEAPVEARARYLAGAYADIAADRAGLREKLMPLVRVRGREVVDGWLALSEAGEHEQLAEALMVQHYDPAYAKSRAAREFETLGTVRAKRLDEAGLEAAADAVERVLDGVKAGDRSGGL